MVELHLAVLKLNGLSIIIFLLLCILFSKLGDIQNFIYFDPLEYSLQNIQLNENKMNFDVPFNFSNNDNIIFLKTHKTASSTLSRVIFREMCENQMRRCFLPEAEHPGKTWNLDSPDDWKQIDDLGANFNVWVHHVIYSRRIFRIISNPRIIVTIIRKPSNRFLSAWNWYEHEKKSNCDIKNFIKELKKFNSFFGFIWSSCFFNTLFDFKYRTGLDATSSELVGKGKKESLSFISFLLYPKGFQEFLSDVLLQKIFLLVTERFDESLLIFSKLMNWPLYKLFYKSHKISNSSISQWNNVLSEEHSAILDQSQRFDFALYRVANLLLDRHILHYNPLSSSASAQPHGNISILHTSSFLKNLSLFRMGNRRMALFCQVVSADGLSAIVSSDSVVAPPITNLTRMLYPFRRLIALCSTNLTSAARRQSRRQSPEAQYVCGIVGPRICNSYAADNREAVGAAWEKQRQRSSVLGSRPATLHSHSRHLQRLREDDLLLSAFLAA